MVFTSIPGRPGIFKGSKLISVDAAVVQKLILCLKEQNLCLVLNGRINCIPE
jgi:hypothetical protein